MQKLETLQIEPLEHGRKAFVIFVSMDTQGPDVPRPIMVLASYTLPSMTVIALGDMWPLGHPQSSCRGDLWRQSQHQTYFPTDSLVIIGLPVLAQYLEGEGYGPTGPFLYLFLPLYGVGATHNQYSGRHN